MKENISKTKFWPTDVPEITVLTFIHTSYYPVISAHMFGFFGPIFYKFIIVNLLNLPRQNVLSYVITCDIAGFFTWVTCSPTYPFH